jgi:hypothetical protein
MRYTVTVRFQFPAWDERDGISIEVQADSKRSAIREGKRILARDGHTGPTVGKGRQTFSATPLED